MLEPLLHSLSFPQQAFDSVCQPLVNGTLELAAQAVAGPPQLEAAIGLGCEAVQVGAECWLLRQALLCCAAPS